MLRREKKERTTSSVDDISVKKSNEGIIANNVIICFERERNT